MNQTVGQSPKSPPPYERLYRLARTIQTCDERIGREVRSGALQAATYPVAGLEGVCAALGVALRRDDYLVSTYRNLGDCIAKGMGLGGIVAEIAGRTTGVAKGKGGSMHLADPSVGMMMTTGIVGSGIPIAVGLALASQLKNEDRVTAVTFGDGATSIGAYHEAMNMAALWRLPVILVCQNNQWAEHTPIAEYAPSIDLAGRAQSYGIEALRVDGFDSVATLRAMEEAIVRARQGYGPTFIEAVTYRLSGHTATTDSSYMPEDEVESASADEPVSGLRRQLAAEGFADTDIRAMDASIEDEIEAAFSFAYESAWPVPTEAYTDVLALPASEASRSQARIA